ncbi:MAG: hypothetical protein AAGC55_25570, partial [Myxococcota bacterium]
MDDPSTAAGFSWIDAIRKRRGQRLLIVEEHPGDRAGAQEVFDKLAGIVAESDCPSPFSLSWLTIELAGELAGDSHRVRSWHAPASRISDQEGALETFLDALRRHDELPDAILCHGSRAFSVLATGLLRVDWSRVIRGCVVYSSTPADLAAPAAPGLANAIFAENRNHRHVAIAADGPLAGAEWISLALAELLLADDRGPLAMARYRAGRRQHSGLVPLVDTPLTAAPDGGGVYIVTDAATELGRSLTEYLRSELNAAVVALDAAELADRHALVRAAEQARRTAGELRGVFYLAGHLAGHERSASAAAMSAETAGRACLVTKTWRERPIEGRQPPSICGTALVLVNAETAKWAMDAADQLGTDDIAVLSSQPLPAQPTQYPIRHVDMDDREGCEGWVEELLQQYPEVALVVDLSDLSAHSHSRTHMPWGKIQLLQRLIGRFSDLSVLHLTRGLQRVGGEPMSLAGAKLAGLVKMLSAEYA